MDFVSHTYGSRLINKYMIRAVGCVITRFNCENTGQFDEVLFVSPNSVYQGVFKEAMGVITNIGHTSCVQLKERKKKLPGKKKNLNQARYNKVCSQLDGNRQEVRTLTRFLHLHIGFTRFQTDRQLLHGIKSMLIQQKLIIAFQKTYRSATCIVS
ncbi:hypothetical protein OUZ56_030397 [Daphnia magna]|uniref:Uncharacterized protein n=1 Tax=Daphnia magna TaxID=35525 RepID=A0ABQ9ZR79_9CRUS|nr:hypothetical protein OUZ56_030397 [Daphnia magna]